MTFPTYELGWINHQLSAENAAKLERVSRSGIAYAWEKATKASDLDGFRFHDLRHSAASFMVQGGVPLNTVRVVLGRKSIAMTLRYAHLAPDHQADAMAALDAVLESPVKSPATHSTTAGLKSP